MVEFKVIRDNFHDVEACMSVDIPEVKYCSDYDETCHELENPTKCFLGGTWTCENGHTSDVPIADGPCKMIK